MRVVVLGAGASLHAGYPLAGNMGHSLAAWINNRPTGHEHRGCLDQIIKVYGTLDNFESILADLMTCPPGSPAAALQARPYLLTELKEALRNYFDAIRCAPALLYDGLARILRRDDLVITFNYDLGVERSLREAGLWNVTTGYGFSIGREELSPVDVLKLHGSTNWRALLFEGRRGFSVGDGNSLGRRPVLPFRPDLEYLGYPDFVDPRCAGFDTAASRSAMVMPALPKQFYFETTYGVEWKSLWDGLWSQAKQAIECAEELAIIGYSLPTADERARDLLLGNENKRVRLSICCADATAKLKQEFCDHGFVNIQDGASTFDEFLMRENHATRPARRPRSGI